MFIVNNKDNRTRQWSRSKVAKFGYIQQIFLARLMFMVLDRGAYKVYAAIAVN